MKFRDRLRQRRAVGLYALSCLFILVAFRGQPPHSYFYESFFNDCDARFPLRVRAFALWVSMPTPTAPPPAGIDDLHLACQLLECAPNRLLVEVGGAGLTALYAAAHNGMSVAVFDPHPEHMARLDESRCLNAIQTPFVTHPRRLASRPHGATTTTTSPTANATDGVTLDAALSSNQTTHIEVLLFTCRACALEVLQGAPGLLAERRIRGLIWRHRSPDTGSDLALVHMLWSHGFHRIYSLAPSEEGLHAFASGQTVLDALLSANHNTPATNNNTRTHHPPSNTAQWLAMRV
jgi:hypothetical protein